MSMLVSLTDGLTTNTARVTKGGRIETEGITRNHESNASLYGDAYIVASGIVNLTSANETAVLYIKNNETRDMIVSRIEIYWGVSTGGSAGEVIATITRNPTAGTIIDNASTAGVPGLNLNHGSAKTLADSLFYKGAEGYTITASDGDIMIDIAPVSKGVIVFSFGALDIPQGTSLGIEFDAPASNTSLNVIAEAEVYLREELQ